MEMGIEGINLVIAKCDIRTVSSGGGTYGLILGYRGYHAGWRRRSLVIGL